MDYTSQIIRVDLAKFLFDTEHRNEILVEIQNIQAKSQIFFRNGQSDWAEPRNLLFEHSRKDQLRDHLRHLFYVISQNQYIIHLDFVRAVESSFMINIPGSLIIEWLRINEYVTKVSYCFYDDQSEFELLCNAIQENMTIKCFHIMEMNLNETRKIELLANAFRDSKIIISMEFDFINENHRADITFLREILGPDSNIKSFHLNFDTCYFVLEEENAHALENIISVNKKITSFKLTGTNQPNILPLVRGVRNSVLRYGCISEFWFEFDWLREEQQNLIFQQIREMKSLKYFSFCCQDFNELSPEIIDTNLKAMKSLDYLRIKSHIKKLPGKDIKQILEKISAWERKCKVEIFINHYYHVDDVISILSVLDNVWLEKITINRFDFNMLSEFSKYLMKWKSIKEVALNSPATNIMVDDPIVKQLNFAAAICKNYSLEKVFIVWGTYKFQPDAKFIIDQALLQHKLFAKSIVTPASVPDWQWPILLEMANSADYLDFSFQVLPYLFSRFLLLSEHHQKQGRQINRILKKSNKKKKCMESMQLKTE